MWYGFNEDWERRGEYLPNALFRDISLLSPESEEEGSRSRSPIHLSPSRMTARSSAADCEPLDDLPPLIIEREPNRHDESDASYEQRAHRMRRLHRRLFTKNHNLNESFDEHGTDENSGKLPSVHTRDPEELRNKASEKNISKDGEQEERVASRSPGSKSSQSGGRSRSKPVKFQAEVHKEVIVEDVISDCLS